MEIHDCCLNGDIRRLLVLIQRGININGRDYMGRTPLYIASFCGWIELVRELLNRGADPNIQVPNPEYQGPGGATALHGAIFWGHMGVVRELLSRGADPTIRDQEGETPLHSASRSGFVSMVEELLKYNVDVSAENNFGNSVMSVAQNDRIRNVLINYLNISDIKEPEGV